MIVDVSSDAVEPYPNITITITEFKTDEERQKVVQRIMEQLAAPGGLMKPEDPASS